jgi:hypothetical protein
VQPFASRDSFTAHYVWPDIENREQDRQVHANGCQSRKPGQNSDNKWSLYRCHWKLTDTVRMLYQQTASAKARALGAHEAVVAQSHRVAQSLATCSLLTKKCRQT